VTEVAVLRDGKRRIVVPADTVWDDFFDAPGIDLPPREQKKIPEVCGSLREALDALSSTLESLSR